MPALTGDARAAPATNTTAFGLRPGREHEAGPTPRSCAGGTGSSGTTFYKWKARFDGMDVLDTRKLKALEDENHRLKKLLAEQMLDNAALEDLVGKSFRRLEAQHWRSSVLLRVMGCRNGAHRGFWGLIGRVRYRRKRKDDAADRELLRALASERRRFGYRRLRGNGQAQGRRMNLIAIRLARRPAATAWYSPGRARSTFPRPPPLRPTGRR